MQITVMGHCLNALLPADERTIENRVRAAADAGIFQVEPFGGTWPADVDPRKTAELVRHEGAQDWFERLAKAGILVRWFEARPFWLRFGIAGSDAGRNRLCAALGLALP